MKRRDFLKLGGRRRRLRLAGCATTRRRPRRASWWSAAASAAPPRRSTSACGTHRSTSCWSSAIRASFPARSPTWCWPALPAWRTSRAATTACSATACRWCATKSLPSTLRKRSVRLARGGDIAYERLVVSPGIDFTFGDVAGLRGRRCRPARVLHAWKAGPQTVALRRQLEQMRDGGVYVLSIPARALPLPARAVRARQHGRRLLQAGEAALQGAGARRQSRRHLEGAALQARLDATSIRESSSTAAIRAPSAWTARRMTVKLEVEDVKGDVLNVVPPHRAGDIAAQGRAHHHQQPLVRRRLAHHGIEGGQGRARARRRDALGARRCRSPASMANNHAKIAAARDRRAAQRPRAAAGEDHQHLLQLRLAEGSDPRLVGARVGARPGHADRR